MRRLFVAAHVPEAYLVRGLLAHAGIAARVFNEYSQGALGELPPTVIHPEVWIEDDRDLALARRIIERYEHDRAATGSRRCPACGEENPAGFEVCWHCGKPF
jgi:hypothetical protein